MAPIVSPLSGEMFAQTFIPKAARIAAKFRNCMSLSRYKDLVDCFMTQEKIPQQKAEYSPNALVCFSIPQNYDTVGQLMRSPALPAFIKHLGVEVNFLH